jgi:hypothetical protein
MRLLVFFIVLWTLACAGNTESGDVAEAVADTLAPQPPPSPIGLYGDWLRVAPPALAGDTLRLAADSTAAGVIPWPPQGLARITRWHLRYASRDAVAERTDWRQGHGDGGDAACFLQREPDPTQCRSLPLICLGGLTEFYCEKFVYTPDSLLFSSGLRYVRIRALTAAAPRMPG